MYDICRNIVDTNLMQLLISVISITTLLFVKKCINERFRYYYFDCYNVKSQLQAAPIYKLQPQIWGQYMGEN